MSLALPNGIQLEANSGLPRLILTTQYAEAEVYLHGAHVARFRPRGASHDLLWMSRESWFEPGKPIRGGVPVIFPWFGPHPTRPDLPAHGFARTRPWSLVSASDDGDRAAVTFSLAPDDDSRRLWPHAFELRYTVEVGRKLAMTLETRNLSHDSFTFEQALHTYFTVSNVRQIEVTGLEGREYIDKMDGGARKTQQGPIGFTGETDRVYLNTADTVTIRDEGLGRAIAVSKEGSGSTVVWNPWIDKARRMPDYGDEEWPGMVCIETANAGENAIQLSPGMTHAMKAVIGLK